MRVRLREAARQPEAVQDHRQWPAHVIRVEAMVDMGRVLLPLFRPTVVADLSTGDAAVPLALRESHGCRLLLGDLAPGYPYHGPIEETALMVPPGFVDLWVLGETLEHLEDPEWVLRAVRERAACLLVSTPIAETSSTNPEHLWGWDEAEVEGMLREAGWDPVLRRRLDDPAANGVYDFQLWGCE